MDASRHHDNSNRATPIHGVQGRHGEGGRIMISDEKLRHYAVNFLKDEIAAIDKTLKNVRTEGEKDLLQNLQRDLRHDLEEIEREENNAR